MLGFPEKCNRSNLFNWVHTRYLDSLLKCDNFRIYMLDSEKRKKANFRWRVQPMYYIPSLINANNSEDQFRYPKYYSVTNTLKNDNLIIFYHTQTRFCSALSSFELLLRESGRERKMRVDDLFYKFMYSTYTVENNRYLFVRIYACPGHLWFPQ